MRYNKNKYTALKITIPFLFDRMFFKLKTTDLFHELEYYINIYGDSLWGHVLVMNYVYPQSSRLGSLTSIKDGDNLIIYFHGFSNDVKEVAISDVSWYDYDETYDTYNINKNKMWSIEFIDNITSVDKFKEAISEHGSRYAMSLSDSLLYGEGSDFFTKIFNDLLDYEPFKTMKVHTGSSAPELNAFGECNILWIDNTDLSSIKMKIYDQVNQAWVVINGGSGGNSEFSNITEGFIAAPRSGVYLQKEISTNSHNYIKIKLPITLESCADIEQNISFNVLIKDCQSNSKLDNITFMISGTPNSDGTWSRYEVISICPYDDYYLYKNLNYYTVHFDKSENSPAIFIGINSSFTQHNSVVAITNVCYGVRSDEYDLWNDGWEISPVDYSGTTFSHSVKLYNSWIGNTSEVAQSLSTTCANNLRKGLVKFESDLGDYINDTMTESRNAYIGYLENYYAMQTGLPDNSDGYYIFNLRETDTSRNIQMAIPVLSDANETTYSFNIYFRIGKSTWRSCITNNTSQVSQVSEIVDEEIETLNVTSSLTVQNNPVLHTGNSQKVHINSTIPEDTDTLWIDTTDMSSIKMKIYDTTNSIWVSIN